MPEPSTLVPKPPGEYPEEWLRGLPADDPTQGRRGRFRRRPTRDPAGRPPRKQRARKPKEPKRRRPNPLAGGRWLVFVGRALLWLVIGLIAINGVYAIAVRNAPPEAEPPPPPEALFPRDEAAGFATRFAHDYLSWDNTRPGDREQALLSYLPEGADPRLGWDGRGDQVVVLALPSTVAPVDDRHAVVTVSAEIYRGDEDIARWVHLAVPVHSDGGGHFVVTAQPTYVAPPRIAAAPPLPATEESDELYAELTEPLTSFFAAWAEGRISDLQYFSSDVVLDGLGGLVQLEAVERIAAVLPAEGGGDRHDLVVTVRWSDEVAESTFAQDYAVAVVRREDRWYVESLGAAGLPASED